MNEWAGTIIIAYNIAPGAVFYFKGNKSSFVFIIWVNVRRCVGRYVLATQSRLQLRRKIFYPKLSRQILRHIYRVLNIDKKKLIAQFDWKS